MDLLYLPHHSPRKYHPLLPKLRLIACKLSGMPSASSRFLDMLPRQSLVAGDLLRGDSISQQIGKWLHFCTNRKIDPLQAAVSEGINFLQDEFASGASYSSLNTARSALSFILPVHGHSVTFGMDHLVRKSFRGVLKADFLSWQKPLAS